MKVQALTLSVLASSTVAFAPARTQFSKQVTTQLSAIDPSTLHDIAPHVDSLNHFISSLMLSDGEIDATGAMSMMDAAPAPDAVADAAQGNGWFGFLTGPIEGLLKLIHVALMSVGFDADAWGVSIIAMTIVIKLLTFPLTKSQLESTNKMQVSLIK